VNFQQIPRSFDFPRVLFPAMGSVGISFIYPVVTSWLRESGGLRWSTVNWPISLRRTSNSCRSFFSSFRTCRFPEQPRPAAIAVRITTTAAGLYRFVTQQRPRRKNASASHSCMAKIARSLIELCSECRALEIHLRTPFSDGQDAR